MLKNLNNVKIESLKGRNSSTLTINALRMKQYIWNKTSSFCPILFHPWGLLYRVIELIGTSPPHLTLYFKILCCYCYFFLRSLSPAWGFSTVEWIVLWASSSAKLVIIPPFTSAFSFKSIPTSLTFMNASPSAPFAPLCFYIVFFYFNSFTICWVYRRGEDKGKKNLPSF